MRVCLLLLSCLLAGCTSTHVSKVGDSWTVVRKGFGAKTEIGELTVQASTNGVTTFVLRRYKNDQTEVVAAAVGAAVSAAK